MILIISDDLFINTNNRFDIDEYISVAVSVKEIFQFCLVLLDRVMRYTYSMHLGLPL